MLHILVLTAAAVLAGCTTTSRTMAEAPQGDIVVSGESSPRHEAGDGLMFNILAAEIAARSGDHAGAFDYYQRAAAQSEHPAVAERGAKLSIHSQNVVQTIEATQRWLQLEPESVEANRILGALYLRNKQLKQAQQQFSKLLQLHKKDRLVGFQIVAEQLRKEPDGKGAEAVLQGLVEASAEQPEAWYIQGWFYSRKQHNQKALDAVDRALKLKSGWGKAVVLRVSILEALGRNKELEHFLKQQVKDAPDDADVLVRYGQVLLKQNRNYEAVLQFEQALELRPRSAQILGALALLQISEHKYEKARPLLMRLIELPGQKDKANFYLGEMEKGLKNLPDAIAHYASVGKGALYLNARVEMATLLAEDDVDAGLSILRGISIHDPRKRVQMIIIEAGMLEGAKRFAEAIKLYDQALKLAPENEELLYSRAMAADQMGDLAALERDLQAIVQKNPKHYHAWNALGYTLTLRTQRYVEARGYLEKALALRPNDFYVLDSMGWVLYKLKEIDSAIDYLERALKAKQDAEVAAHLGEVRWVNGDYEAARKAWQQGKKIDSNNSVLLETLRRFNQ